MRLVNKKVIDLFSLFKYNDNYKYDKPLLVIRDCRGRTIKASSLEKIR